MGILERKMGWPERLVEVVESAMSKPYCLGTWDCVIFVGECIKAMTGADVWPDIAGQYTTRREALKVIASIAPSFPEAITLRVGPEKPIPFARRGDILMYVDAGGEHVGVCIGDKVALLHEDGLLFISLASQQLTHCWGIG